MIALLFRRTNPKLSLTKAAARHLTIRFVTNQNRLTRIIPGERCLRKCSVWRPNDESLIQKSSGKEDPG